MRPLLAAVLLSMTGCAWEPVAHAYPSGLVIVRADQDSLDRVCSHTSDEGKPIKHAAGCYEKRHDTIWILNNPSGAQALVHELAHREGIANPKAEGFSW